MIKLGNNNIGKIYLGNNSIGKAYLGSNLVFQKGSSPTPPAPTILPVFYDNLVFDGTAYVETDILTPTDASITATFGNETSKATQCLFGQGNASLYICRGAFYNTMTSATNRVIAARYNNNTAATASLAFSGNATYNFFLTPNKFGWGNTANNVTKSTQTPTTGIFFGKNNGTAVPAYTGTLGTVRIYDSSAQNVATYAGFESFTPVATLRPCTYDGVPGLWYVEGNKFYGNSAGAGSLSVSNNE